ncbi:MAG: hypothetical protein JO001_19570 [Alphaproteobacteria bacterium]|nr:hypothetical protein [Alphaproteobacteria bacterium]
MLWLPPLPVIGDLEAFQPPLAQVLEQIEVDGPFPEDDLFTCGPVFYGFKYIGVQVERDFANKPFSDRVGRAVAAQGDIFASLRMPDGIFTTTRSGELYTRPMKRRSSPAKSNESAAQRVGLSQVSTAEKKQ